ncbi:RND superfamily putative drug exporter [Homoserinimonas aerilata]|uniref:RND superfamily putative drug exporter n=1 Tax=Homoserinimonas aerilata TaxID=1162970 RepID=A0A542YHD6_9MICO|nr:MMPL family transporter [Homoserinimonas aerilata]TQL47497.1 RND superfamily putative drug exporter [Homoserinimonas aerilata]
MATLLYRLGRFSYRRAWTVIAAWAVILLAILGGGFALGGNMQESFAIPGTESQEALDHLEAVFPQVAGASAQAVVVAPDGTSVADEANRAAIDEMVAEIGRLGFVDSVMGPFDEYAGEAVSDDKGTARIQVQFDGSSAEVTDAMLAELTATAEIGEDAGMQVEFGGQVFQQSSFGVTIVEVFGVVFAAVVLLITFGSLMAAGMPLLSALIGVGITIGGILLASEVTTVSNSAPLLALMIGLAVGIDYALFILSRHRTQLALGDDPEESAGMAVGTAGSAVVFAGVTVIIALLGLLVVNIPFLSIMGIGAAFAVLVAIGVAVTLLPALLGLAGARLAPKPGSRSHRRANALNDPNAKPSMGLRWVRGVMKVPVLATVGVVGLLGVLAVPALSLELNLPDNGAEAADSTQRKAYDLIADGFGPGFNGPLIVSIDITQTTDVLDDLEGIADELRGLDDVAYVSQGIPDATLDTAIVQVTPSGEPSATSTKELVQAIRDLAPQLEREYGTAVSVTGFTAIGIDISQRLTDALIPFALIVVGLSIVLLMIVFRSVLVPIKAALGFLLSVFAALGVTVAVFQWGWGAELIHVDHLGPILSFMPILVMAVLFGLAMDYEVFLVSGMREEFVHTGNARRAVERGFAGGARVVTAAALIMFFVFFAFVPEGAGMIKPIALGLATGIAFDAFLVRMTLVPAVMTLLGRRAWWLPAWLARILPHADIEGVHLRDHRDAIEWTRTQGDAAISAESLVVGVDSTTVGPFQLSVPRGAVVLASGDPAARRMLAATLAGRIAPVSGRAQVLGHPLPSEAPSVSRIVAMADAAGADDGDLAVTFGQLLRERITVTVPWYRATSVRRTARRWASRAGDTVTSSRLSADSVVRQLPQLERGIALSTVAIAEGTPIVMLDLFDAFADAGDEAAFVAAVSRLAPSSTTIVIGTPIPLRGLGELQAGGRHIVPIDLYGTASEPSAADDAAHTDTDRTDVLA